MNREPITSQTILKRKFEELLNEFDELKARVAAIEARKPGRPKNAERTDPNSSD